MGRCITQRCQKAQVRKKDQRNAGINDDMAQSGHAFPSFANAANTGAYDDTDTDTDDDTVDDTDATDLSMTHDVAGTKYCN